MSARRTESGTAKRYIVEIGPLTVHGFGKGEIKRMERSLLRKLDAEARRIVAAGPYSKAVQSRTEEAPDG